MHAKFQAARFHGFGVMEERHTLTHTDTIIVDITPSSQISSCMDSHFVLVCATDSHLSHLVTIKSKALHVMGISRQETQSQGLLLVAHHRQVAKFSITSLLASLLLPSHPSILPSLPRLHVKHSLHFFIPQNFFNL